MNCLLVIDREPEDLDTRLFTSTTANVLQRVDIGLQLSPRKQ